MLRTATLITFGMCIICIISGCSDDDPIEADEVRLLSTVPEDGGIVSATGELTITFDGFPTSVYVDGKLAIIQGNTAIVKVTDLPNLLPGTDNTVTIEWRNQENLPAGSETITVTVLKPVTVVVDPPPRVSTKAVSYSIPRKTKFTLTFNEEVIAVIVNDTPASGSGLSWEWSAQPLLPYGSVTLTIKWTNRDGSGGSATSGPYEVGNVYEEPPQITSGTVFDGEVDVHPGPINAGGLRFDFDRPITGTIKLTDEAGVDLNWVGNVVGQTATLTAVAGQEMVNETTYKIEIDIQDDDGNKTQMTVTFVTKPK